MAYPQVSHTARTGTASRAVEPVVPADRGSGAGLLGRRRHVPGERGAARRRRGRGQRVRLLRRPAVRERAAALRPPADRVRQGPGAEVPDHARPPRRAPLRLGHPRPARRARGDAPARHEDDRGDPRARHREVQRGVPQVRLRVHLGVARLRDPPGPLGRLRQRLQDPRPPLHGERHVGVQAAARQGAGLRGVPGPALLLERRDPAVQPRAADGRGRLPAARRPRRHRRPAAHERSGRGCAGPHLDDDPLDAGGEPRRDGRPRHRLRGRGVGLHGDDGAVPARGGPPGGVREGAGGEPRGAPALPRRRPAREHLHAADVLLPGPRARVPRRRGRHRHHRGRHRAGAHRGRLR